MIEGEKVVRNFTTAHRINKKRHKFGRRTTLAQLRVAERKLYKRELDFIALRNERIGVLIAHAEAQQRFAELVKVEPASPNNTLCGPRYDHTRA